MKMETQKLKDDISTYHHNIKNYEQPNITSHLTIYNIYSDVITNPEFTIVGADETLKDKCEKIRNIQSHINTFKKGSKNYKKLKAVKDDLKHSLGGCYFQIYKPKIKKSEDDNRFTGYVVIDIDDYDNDYDELKGKLKNIPEVLMVFTSPSGGLKIVVSTDLHGELGDKHTVIPNYDRAIYQNCYELVISYFKESHDIVIDYDPTAKSNYNLICFYAYDAEAYLNDNHTQFECYAKAILQFEEDQKHNKVVPLKGNNPGSMVSFNKELPFIKYTDEETDELVSKSFEGYVLEGADDYTTWMKYNYALYALVKENYLVVAVNMFGEYEREHIEGFYNSAKTGDNEITIASLIRYAQLAGYQPKSNHSEHPYANVIDMNREQQLVLKKQDLTKWDMNQPVPNEIYPNFTIVLKSAANGAEKEVFKKRKSNDNLFALMVYLGIDLSFDVIKGMNIGVIPYYKKYNGSNDEEILHNDLEDIININEFPKDKVSHLLRLHHSNSFNALTDMCKSVEWDGVDRIQQVKDCLKVFDGYDDWLDIAIKKWLVQCVAAWDNARNTPNANARAIFDNVLILSGAQGINKSSFFEGLLPKELNGYFKGGVYLDPSNSDSVRQATKFGMVELGEIDTTFSKSAISLLKAFLSTSHDLYREAYAKKDTEKERRTSYCGSVNGMQFLRDLTGNRRYYPISVHDIDFDAYTLIDKTQLWAQIWQLYTSGGTWWLDKNSDEANIHKLILEQHMEADPMLDKLKGRYDLTIVNDRKNGQEYTSQKILEMLDYINFDDQKIVRHLNRLLEGLGFIPQRKNNSSSVWYLTTIEASLSTADILDLITYKKV